MTDPAARACLADAQARVRAMAFVETGYVDGLNRNRALSDRQRLMDDGYIKTAAVLAMPTKSLRNALVSV